MTTTYTPGTRIDHYEILRMLGQCGMNRVYLAEHILNRQKVFLKFPNAECIGIGVALLEGARRVTWRGLSGTVGTPDYMSPEQLRGHRGTVSSDIYSVGAMLYELLT